jgi:hypothetical protein
MSIVKKKDLELEMSLLINDRLIFCYSDDNRSEEEVIRIYAKLLINRKKIPTFQAVLEGVRSYNWDVFYDAACMKFDYTYGVRDGDYECAGEEIHDIACDIEDEYNLSDNAALDFYVGHVLRKHMLSCEIEPEDNIFQEEGMVAIRYIRDVRILINDCQNVLFFEFLVAGVAGYGDFVNYYNAENNDSVLFLNKG